LEKYGCMRSEAIISEIERKVLEKLAERGAGSISWLSAELGKYVHYMRGILEVMEEKGLVKLVKGKRGVIAVFITDLGRKVLEEAKANIAKTS